MDATPFLAPPVSEFITALFKLVGMSLPMAVTRPVLTLESTSQLRAAMHRSFSNKRYRYSMVMILGLVSRFPSANSPPSKSITYWYREWDNVIPLTSMMYWKIIVIISLMSSWKYWQRGVSDCRTLSIDVHHGPPSSTVWYLSVTWTFSTTQNQRRRRARRTMRYRMSTNLPIRAATPFYATRMSSVGLMASIWPTLTTMTWITIKTVRAQRRPIQTEEASGASKQTSME